MAIRTFENSVFPSQERWEYALSNVASDATNIADGLEERFEQIAPSMYNRFQSAAAKPCIGVMNLLLPVGCNATCPNICFTDIANWKRRADHLTFDQLLEILAEFKELGGKFVRVVGEGEPVLYPELVELCEWTRKNDIALLLFTNGVTMPNPVLEQYAKGNLYLYIKLWSEDAEVQNRLVAPRTPYQYVDGQLGLAPKSFYELYEIDAERVGFQVMGSTLNEADARRIVESPKVTVPLFLDPFVPEGSGAGHHEYILTDFPFTKGCSMPPRSSYLAVVNSRGQLQAGTFIQEEAELVTHGRLRDVWEDIFANKDLFFQSRYSGGCFCETMRAKK